MKTPRQVLPAPDGAAKTEIITKQPYPVILPQAEAEIKEESMDQIQILLTHEQFEFLTERLDAAQNAAELAWLLAQA